MLTVDFFLSLVPFSGLDYGLDLYAQVCFSFTSWLLRSLSIKFKVNILQPCPWSSPKIPNKERDDRRMDSWVVFFGCLQEPRNRSAVNKRKLSLGWSSLLLSQKEMKEKTIDNFPKMSPKVRWSHL